MHYRQSRAWLDRPYWSPAHPSKYILVERVTDKLSRRSGWGLLYPDCIGSFNLLWLLGGAGQPLGSYKPYHDDAHWVADNLTKPVGKLQLNEAAALCTLPDFLHLIERSNKHRMFDRLLAAAAH